MVLDRLTQRAKNVLTLFEAHPKGEAQVSELVSSIALQGGIGYLVLSNFPPLPLDKSGKVAISEVIKQAYMEASSLKHIYVGTEHLLLATLKIIGSKEYKNLQKRILGVGTYPKIPKKSVSFTKRLPILDAFGTNLNLLYEEGIVKDQIERTELSDLVSVLLQRRKSSPLLVGDGGVGKSSLVKLLAQKICNYEVPSALANSQIIEFDLNGFMSGVIGREGIEAGLSALHDEVVSSPEIVLYISDIHMIFMPVGASFLPPFVGSLFKSYILDSGVCVIASATSNNFQKYMLEDESVLDFFSLIRVKEPSKDITIDVMKGKARDFEKFHLVKIKDATIEEAYTLAEKHIKSKKFPQKGIELMDKACALLLLERSMLPKKFGTLKRRKQLLAGGMSKALTGRNFDSALNIKKKLQTIDQSLADLKFELNVVELKSEYLSLALSRELNVPLGNLTSDEEEIFGNLPHKLKGKITGQEKAVEGVSMALIRARLGLRSKKRPMGSFLFLGPTGVGKTELARVLAEVVFGPSGLIKLDMSDFSERHTVSRLVGAPPGYIGYSEGGELTEKIAKNPYSVVLFDEIEKAHPDVLNILLQIMEDGTLVDARGRAFDFTSAIIILTSNLGSELVNKEDLGYSINTEVKLDTSRHATEVKLLHNLKSILRPELLNRLDDIVVFNKLTTQDSRKILDLMLAEARKNLTEKGFDIKIDTKAKDFLLKEGFSDEYGARALRRMIDKLIVDELAKMILKGKLKKGSVVTVKFDKALKFETSLSK